MGLHEYRRKRDFSRTPEPEGQKQASASVRLYVIQKHATSRLHYDLRLELDGALKSWAVPKGPSLDPEEKRLAVQVEDHPIEYGAFEGIIPEGEYGAGTVLLWDRGEWKPEGDPRESYRRGRLKFRLHGKKLRGSWALVRMHGASGGEEGQNWLLLKHADEHARPAREVDIAEAEPLSAATGRSLEEITRERDQVWLESGAAPGPGPAGGKIDPSALPGARPAPPPERLRPQQATLVSEPPLGPDWIHEIKYDGYRILCLLKDGRARLWTRQGKDWTDRFPEIARAAAALPLEPALLDGEIVVLRPDGTTDFQALQNVLEGIQGGTLIYYLFDLPYFQGYDLTRTPLVERKRFLRLLLESHLPSPSPLRYSDHISGEGPEVSSQACRLGAEGIVSKRADSPYEQRRTRAWLKVKCLQRQEFMIGGYTEPSGVRTGFGALLLGYYDREGHLVYAGRVGTGFTEESVARLAEKLRRRAQAQSPFHRPPQGREARGVHWTAPELVAEVEFTAWTQEGVLRHPSFKGLREDKSPREIVFERPEPPPEDEAVPPEEPARRFSVPSSRRVGGVPLSHPDRLFYPEGEVTKHDLALFYEKIAPWILPHVVRRPLTLFRCPQGHEEECFFQKHLEEPRPDSIRVIPIREKDEVENYPVIDDLAGLISLVQLGVLEIHIWGSREEDLERPDQLVFDLDPGPDVPWEEVLAAAALLRDRLADLKLESFVKTSGGKGLHVLAPLAPRADWGDVKSFARAVAEGIVRQAPRRFVATMSKEKRGGKIFIDYLRNGRGATTVAAYSTRARPGAPVSTPLSWQELSPNLRADSYSVANLPERLSSLSEDPWARYFRLRQSLTPEMEKAVGLE